MVCFIFLCPYFNDPFKIASMNVVWEILPKFQAIKKFKKTIKSLNYFGKQSMFTTLFLLSLNSCNLLEGRDTFQLIQQQKMHATQCRNFLEHKETFRTLKKISRHSGKFPHNMETLKTIWELSRQYGKCT